MPKRATSQTGWIKTSLRLPPELHASVIRAAEDSGRTFNAELMERIASAEDRRTLSQLVEQNAKLEALMREMLERIELLR
jgi:hypothetical protein